MRSPDPPSAAADASMTVVQSPSSRPTFEQALEKMKEILPNLDAYNGDSVPRRTGELTRFLEASFGATLKGKTVADLGAGNGGPLLWMYLDGGAARGIAVERDPNRVMIMEGVVAELAIDGIEIHLADFNSFDAAEASVDVVSVMDLAPSRKVELQRLVSLAARMVRPGGHLVLKGTNDIYRYAGVKRDPSSQLMPLRLADVAETYFTGEPPAHAMYAAPAIARLLLASGFDDPAMSWSSGAQWRNLAKPAKAHPCLSHWYLAAQRGNTSAGRAT